MYESLQTGSRVRLGSGEVRVLVTERQIEDRVAVLGQRLREKVGSEFPIFIAMLTGGFVFLTDLIRVFGEEHEVDFLKVSRYDPKQKDPTAVRVMHDLRSEIKDRTVVVVEGIRARGTKIQYVDRFLRLRQPRRIEYCAMIQPADAQLAVPLDESGFQIDNEFVVGYGLDYRERYRNLPFVGAMETITRGDGFSYGARG